jgi:hypothetical protein
MAFLLSTPVYIQKYHSGFSCTDMNTSLRARIHSQRTRSWKDLPGTQPGYPEGFGDLTLKGEITTETCRIRVADSGSPQVDYPVAPKIDRYPFPKPEIGLDSPLISRKMVPEIIKEPFRFLIRDTDHRDPGLVCNPPGIENIEPRDYATGEQDYIEIPSIQIPDHAEDSIGSICSANHNPAKTESVNAEVFSHHDTGKRGMFAPGITLRDPQCPQSLFGDMHRSTYDTRLKILYQ